MQLLGQLSEGGTLVTHSKAVLQPQPCGEPWEGQGGPSVRLSVCGQGFSGVKLPVRVNEFLMLAAFSLWRSIK